MELICLGDSLTAGYGVRAEESWTALASGAAGLHIVNHGLSGDTTTGMLFRLGQLLASPASEALRRGESAFFLMGGSNDIFYSGTDSCARSNIGALLEQLDAVGARPIVGIPLPVCTELVPGEWAPVVDAARYAALELQYADWLRKYCGIFGIPTVDFAADFLSGDGAAIRSLYLDGIHPTPEGHRLMARRFLRLWEGRNRA